MKEAFKSSKSDESIVPSDSEAFECLQSQCSADALAYYEHEKLRYLLVSDFTNTVLSHPQAKTRRRSREFHRKDFTEQSTYKNELTGITFEINNKQGQGLYLEIMNSAVNQLATCFGNWGRVTAIRVDLHMANQSTDNKVISKLFKSVNKKIKARFTRHRNQNIGYCWVAEIGSKSKKKHYHLHLYIDGNCARTSHHIEEMVRTSWAAIDKGNTTAPVTYYKYCTTIEQLHGAVYDMSYLAKSKDKGYQAKNINEYGASRIKAKNK